MVDQREEREGEGKGGRISCLRSERVRINLRTSLQGLHSCVGRTPLYPSNEIALKNVVKQ